MPIVWAICSFSAESRFLRSCQSFGIAKVRLTLEPETSWLSAGTGFADASAWLDEVLLADVSSSLLSFSLSAFFSSASLVFESEAAELEESEPWVI